MRTVDTYVSIEFRLYPIASMACYTITLSILIDMLCLLERLFFSTHVAW